MLGGRCAKPHRYMSGGSDFNGELFGAEPNKVDNRWDLIGSCRGELRVFMFFIDLFCKMQEVDVSFLSNKLPMLGLDPHKRIKIAICSQCTCIKNQAKK